MPPDRRPGVASTTDADYDTFPYCGDTRRTSLLPTDDSEVIIVQVENLQTSGDGDQATVVYEQDLPDNPG
jgi:hypothetical protein